MKRYTVTFSGRVQGVGFRYTTARIAGGYEVSGYVQNLADGCVRLVAEGEPDELHSFVGEVCRTMSRYVDEHAVEQSAANGEFDRFDVRY